MPRCLTAWVFVCVGVCVWLCESGCVGVWLCGCLAVWVFVWVSGCVGRQQVPVCGGDAQFTNLVLSPGFGSFPMLLRAFSQVMNCMDVM